MTRFTNIIRAFTRTERVIFFAATLFAAAAGGALILSGLQRITTVVPARGGTLVEGIVGQPTYVNPILAESDADRALVRLLFAPLPDLAEKIEADATNRTWRVRLKEGIVWSDGRKITSDDIIFTVQRMQDPETRSPLYANWQGVTANRLSELELQFNLVSPYPFFGETLGKLYPIPKHLFADTPSANWRLSDYNLEPIGSGPYLFRSYEKESSGFIPTYTLAANPAYVDGRPYIDTFVFRFYPRMDDVISAFNSGLVGAFADFNPETAKRIKRSYQTVSYTVPSYYAVFLNQSQNIAFKEPEVRKALASAVDRTALISRVFAGNAKLAASPLVSSQNKQEQDPLFAVAEAGAALDAAGWERATSTDNVREKVIKGVTVRLAFDLVVPDIPFLTDTAAFLRESWAAIGVDARIVSYAPEDILNRIIRNREYHALLFGNFLQPARDLYPFWHSNERFYPGLNLSLYDNEDADELIERIRRDPSESSRAAALAELETVIGNDAPAVFLYSPDYLYFASKDLRGATDGPLAGTADRYERVGRWHLRTTRALQ